MNQSWMATSTTMALRQAPRSSATSIEEAQGLAGSVYGRQMYEVMRYWDDDHPEWNAENAPSRRRGGTSEMGSSRAR